MTKTLSLVSADWIKALFMAVITPVIGYVATIVPNGSFAIDWHQVAILAISGGLGYLVKQLGTSTTLNAPATATVTETVMGVTLPTVLPKV